MLPQSVSCTLSAVWRDAAGELPSTHFTAFSTVLAGDGGTQLQLLDEQGHVLETVDLENTKVINFFHRFCQIGEDRSRALQTVAR